MNIFSVFALFSLVCMSSLHAELSIVDYKPSYHDTIFTAILHDKFLIAPGEEWIQKGFVSEETLQKQFEERFEESLNSDFLIKKVIREEDRIIGCAFYSAPPGDIYCDGEKIKRYVELDLIIVMPEYRNRGIGTALFNHVIEDTQKRWPDIEMIKLDVLATNSSARLFYEKHGFVVSERPLSRHSLEANLISYEKVIK